MGESRWRRENDPLFGRIAKARPNGHRQQTNNHSRSEPKLSSHDIDQVPKLKKEGRGLILSRNVTLNGGGFHLQESILDACELRAALLFWDHLVIPNNNAIFISSSDSDEEFLRKEGVLSRPKLNFTGSMNSSIFLTTQVSTLAILEAREPGQWAVAEGESFLKVQDQRKLQGRGILFQLHRAVPIPEADVPLNEILDFRQKNYSELERLRAALSDIYKGVLNAEDQEHEFSRRKVEIDRACSDLIRRAKDWRYAMRLSDLKAVWHVASKPSLGFLLGQKFELEHVGALVGGAIGLLSIAKDIGLWPAAGLMDTKIRCFMKPEVSHAKAQVQ